MGHRYSVIRNRPPARRASTSANNVPRCLLDAKGGYEPAPSYAAVTDRSGKVQRERRVNTWLRRRVAAFGFDVAAG
jgi:hypothetical protein